MEKGVPIRSVSRALSILQSLNRHGSMTMSQISKESELPYPTTCRLVQTLMVEGYVDREPDRKFYRPTAQVRALSHGYQLNDRLAECSRPVMESFTERHLWPVSIATRIGVNMMIEQSTHAMTTLTFNNYYPGYTLPILESSTGRAYIANCSAEERLSIIAGLEVALGDNSCRSTIEVSIGGILKDYEERGVATMGRNQNTANPGKTSSVAAPVWQSGQCVGSLAMVYFSSSMSVEEAIEKFKDDVVAAAADVSDRLEQAALESGAQ